MKVRHNHRKRYQYVADYYNAIRRDFERSINKIRQTRMSNQEITDLLNWYTSEFGGEEIR